MQRTARYVLGALVLGVVGFAGWRGWQWRAHAKIRRVAVTGAQYAVPDSIRALAGVDTSDVLYGVDRFAVAGRVERHPWVRSVSVTRRPPGVLALSLTERKPVALALQDGTPTYYLDAGGYRMPADAPGAVYDVPLLRNGPAYQSGPVSGDALRALLALLGGLDAYTQTLLSELTLHDDGTVTARTVPTPGGGRGSLRLLLGCRPWAEKLRRLRPFWRQAVVTQPQTVFERVDLRFDGQVVTEQHDRENRDP